MMEENERFKIYPLSPEGRAQRWSDRLAEEGEIHLIYVIIGYLREHWGGYEPSPPYVEGFAKYEYPKALIFKNICNRYLASIHESDDVELTDFIVNSEKIAAILKTYYSKKIEGTRMFTLSDDDDLFRFPWDLESYAGKTYNYLQYSFLIGVFLCRRRTEDNWIIFSGTRSKKALWTIDFLNNFRGFGEDEMKVRYLFNHVPDSASILLSENNVLWSLIDKFVEENNLLKES